MMCSVNCDDCYAKNHCDVVPNSMNCQEVREDAEKEQRIRADERHKFAECLKDRFSQIVVPGCISFLLSRKTNSIIDQVLEECEKER